MLHRASLPVGAVHLSPAAATMRHGERSVALVKARRLGGGCSLWGALRTEGVMCFLRTLKEAQSV